MKKSIFKQLVDSLRRKKRGFSKMIPNPAGSKFRKACLHTSARGADGTMR